MAGVPVKLIAVVGTAHVLTLAIVLSPPSVGAVLKVTGTVTDPEALPQAPLVAVAVKT